jgi:hypothetical protein
LALGALFWGWVGSLIESLRKKQKEFAVGSGGWLGAPTGGES